MKIYCIFIIILELHRYLLVPSVSSIFSIQWETKNMREKITLIMSILILLRNLDSRHFFLFKILKNRFSQSPSFLSDYWFKPGSSLSSYHKLCSYQENPRTRFLQAQSKRYQSFARIEEMFIQRIWSKSRTSARKRQIHSCWHGIFLEDIFFVSSLMETLLLHMGTESS